MNPSPPNRDEQHGGMEAVGSVSQQIKQAMRGSRNWSRLTSGHQEALDMVAHKIARVLSGADPHDPEHWVDVAGYPQAAIRSRCLPTEHPAQDR
jgi:hypothetical protein